MCNIPQRIFFYISWDVCCDTLKSHYNRIHHSMILHTRNIGNDKIWWLRLCGLLDNGTPCNLNHGQANNFIIPPLNEVEGGYAVSPCPSVHLFAYGQNRIRSVSSTILTRSISYLHILSSNFRRCVMYKVFFFKIKKIGSFGKFFKFVTLSLSCFDLGSNVNCSVVWAWDPIWTGE